MPALIHVTETDGASTLTSEPAPEPADLDVKGWRGVTLETAGLVAFMFDIAADADEFPIHADGAQWVAHVLSGSGTVHAGNSDLERTSSTAYTAGDFFSFSANTPHGWTTDGSPSRILFVRRG